MKGRITATGEAVARDVLSCAGYQSVSLKAIKQLGSRNILIRDLFKVKATEIIIFYRQLALLLESGVDIVTAFQLLQSQASNRLLMAVLDEVISDLRAGNQLSIALRKHPHIFSPIYCRTLQVGEQTGNLEAVLRQMADYMEKEANTSKGITNALTYPVITAIVAVMVTIVLVTFVLPAFTRLYASFGVQLPLMTRLLMDAAAILQRYGFFILLLLLLLAGILYFYSRTENGRYRFDKLALRLPLLGRITHLKELSRCGRSISLLFKAGLPMTEIMSLAVMGSNNQVIAKALSEVQQDMLRGEGLSQPMLKNSIFLPMFVQMVSVGEETGTLDTTLMAVAQSYETEVEDKTRSLIGFIQPAMTILIGGGVGLIALSLVSAMYSIYGKVLH